MNKCVFWDRDGTINEVRIVDGKSQPPDCVEHLRLIFGIRQLMDRICKMGYLNIVVTNQPDIERKKTTAEEVEKINKAILEFLPLDDLYMCPHDGNWCYCRKPKAGMLLMAKEKYNIDLKNSWMIGDRYKDIEAGKSAGCKTILITNEFRSLIPCTPDYIVKSINEIEEIIYNGY